MIIFLNFLIVLLKPKNIDSEMIHRALPANQTLRAWDNVPRFAKAQEITGNRLIFALGASSHC